MAESLHILILEDNPADAELIQFELQEAGFVFTPKLVTTEEDFVRELREFPADLILSDYDLPRYNGALALAEARKRCPDTPFILVTGAVTEDRAIEILTQGAKDYVLKSRLEQRLGPAIRRALAEADEHKKRKKAEAELRIAHDTLEERVKTRTAELEAEITARKKADEALRANEERLRLVLRSSSIGTFEVDLLTGEGQWNDTEFELLGLKPGDVKAAPDTFFRFVHPDDIERLQNEWEEATRSGKLDAEFRMVRADGRECWLAGKGGFIFDGHLAGHGAKTGGKPLRFMGVNFDITERKQAEEMLREGEERYRIVVENTTAIILRVDPSGVINFANSRALEFFGYTADELIGKPIIGSIIPATESTGRDLAAMVNQIIADPDRFHANVNENICKDGRRVWLEWTNTGISSADGRLREILSVGIDATDRKRAEDSLKLHTAIMETAAEGIFLIGLDDNIIKWTNRKFEQLFGYGPGEMIGMHVDRVNAPTERTPTEARISIVEVLRQAGEWHGEIENIKKDGTHFWCRIHVSLFNHPQFGTVMVSAHTDITKRKKMEDTLRVSEERFFKAFKNSPNAITITRISDGKIIEGNDSVYELLGYNHDEVIGKTTFDLGIWADADERVKLIQVLTAKGFIRNQEFTLLKKDRKRVIVDLSASPINIDNQPCFLTSFIDITSRKRAEEALRENQERLALAASATQVGMFDWNVMNGCVLWTQTHEAIFGYAPATTTTTTTTTTTEHEYRIWADRVHPEDLPRVEAEMRRCQQDRKPLEVQYRIIWPDGSLHWVETKGVFQYGSDGKVGRMLGVVMDITERKWKEEATSQSRKIFYDLVERSPFGTYIVDSEFRIAMMNTSSQNRAFINVRPIIGRLFDEAMRILWPEDVAAEIIGHFRHTLETGEPYYSPTFFNPRHDIEIVEGYEWELHRIMLPDGQYGVICYYFDSTKLREAEEGLKESEQKYRSIFENSMDAIFLAIPNEQVLAANPAACAIFGMTEEELCRVGRIGIEDPTDPRHAAAVEERTRTGRVKYEATHVSKDGSKFPSEVSSVIMEGGQRSLVILRDITDRKRVEDELRKSEERFRVAQELSPDGFAILRPVRDSEGRIVDFTFVYENAAIARINGTDPATVVGRRLSEFLPAHSQSPFHEAHAHVADTGETCIMERKYDGGDIPRPTWFRVVVVRTGQDIAILSQDITERKQAEEALRESESRLRRTAKAGHIGFFEWNASKDTAYWSPEHYELFGFEPGSPVSWQRWLKGVHPEDRERTAQSASRLLERGRSEGQVLGHKDQYRYVHDDGTVVWIEADLSVEMVGGEAIVSGSVRDISEWKNAEIAMKCQAEQLEAVNEELESFSYSVSHDLRAPLRAIDGFSRKLEREFGKTADETFAKTITVIRNSAKIMETLIDDLLSFSRVQKEGLSITFIDMHRLIDEVWSDILDANKKRELELKATHILSGYGDRALIRQVLFNLLSNAVKFTKNRKPAIIEITSYPESDHIVYRIKDNGIGFDMKYYDKLFGVFQRLHGEEFKGTGIGLAIVQRIIKRHGGNVWAKAEVDKGATFFFTLQSTMIDKIPGK